MQKIKIAHSISSALLQVAKLPPNLIVSLPVKVNFPTAEENLTKTSTTLNKRKITSTKPGPNSRNPLKLSWEQIKGKNLNWETQMVHILILMYVEIKVDPKWSKHKVEFLWIHIPEKAHKKILWKIVQALIWIQSLLAASVHAKISKAPIQDLLKNQSLSQKEMRKDSFWKKIHHQYINWSQIR